MNDLMKIRKNILMEFLLLDTADRNVALIVGIEVVTALLLGVPDEKLDDAMNVFTKDVKTLRAKFEADMEKVKKANSALLN